MQDSGMNQVPSGDLVFGICVFCMYCVCGLQLSENDHIVIKI